MDARKLRIRVGSHEIEIEGASKEEIDERLAVFKELVLAASVVSQKPNTGKTETVKAKAQHSETTAGSDGSVDHPLAAIFKVEGKTVSLVTPPQGQDREGDAFLLLLLGHRIVRASDWVLVGDLKAGLIDSGFSVDQMDTITGSVTSELYMKKGLRRGKQFRLTNPGAQKAQALAEEILGNIS